jgi:pyruvate dehydrogenase E1 component
MSAVPQFPAANDPDALETQEWLDALEAVLEREGPERAHFPPRAADRQGAALGRVHPVLAQHRVHQHHPDAHGGALARRRDAGERIRSICRWNAMVMVAKANKSDDELGGHIASFASVGTLFGTGQQHFWHAPHEGHGGDLIYFQGHSSPGVYARSLMEGRPFRGSPDQFPPRGRRQGRLVVPASLADADYWQFPTVSMGLGPIQAIYMARYLKYLEARGLAQTANRKVWVFCGDGEMDEPESLGAIGLASREKLDNLIFIVNCNLQRLDGPVRGNGKIIQELEGRVPRRRAGT